MKIGFIGTGAITVALVTGLCTTKKCTESIWVTPRSRAKAEMLEGQFSEVTVGRSNQHVVDNVDLVVLAFLPQDRESILTELKFRNDQLIVNLLSGTPNSLIENVVNESSVIIRAVPLPCAAEHIGPIVVFPANETIDQIFNNLGTVISVNHEEQLENLSVITALMAPYFEMLARITDWATEAGVNQKQAADYTASMFEALSKLASKSPTGDLHQLADESMTPGGLNELARKTIRLSGGYDYLKPVLQAVSNRVRGGIEG